ncbi:hypothetical protein J6590_103482, partial [Homalodisca vitripennis]
ICQEYEQLMIGERAMINVRGESQRARLYSSTLFFDMLPIEAGGTLQRSTQVQIQLPTYYPAMLTDSRKCFSQT